MKSVSVLILFSCVGGIFMLPPRDSCLVPCQLMAGVQICVTYVDGTSANFDGRCAYDYQVCVSKGTPKPVISISNNPCVRVPVFGFDPCLRPCTFDMIRICVTYTDGTFENFPNKCDLEYKLCKRSSEPGIQKQIASQSKCFRTE